MKVTYGSNTTSVNITCPTHGDGSPSQDVWALIADIDPNEVVNFEGMTPSHNLWHLSIPYVPPLKPIELNVLHWPADASRFATFFCIMDDVDLGKLRPICTGSTGPVAQTLTFTPDSVSEGETIAVKMSMLPPRPLSQITNATGVQENGLWLVPLVDQRYFWWMQKGDFPGTASTWSALFSQIASALNVAVTTSTISTNYGTGPSTRFTVYTQPVPLFFDAAARTVGCRVVCKYDGTVLVQNYADATTSENSDQTILQAGARTLFSGYEFSKSDVARCVPSQCVVSFLSQEVNGTFAASPYELTETLTSLALTQYQEQGFISNATNANPIVITAEGHGLGNGNSVTISGVTGNTAANGTFTITYLNANQFSIPVAGSGTYTGGGVFGAAIVGYSGTKQIIGDPIASWPGTITLTITAAMGTFSLTFGGQTTSSLAFNASTSAVQTALQALSSIGLGVTVTGTPGSSYTITLTSAVSGTSSPMTVAFSGGCTGSISNVPSNNTAITNFAVQSATDWYLWRLVLDDIQLISTVAWIPNGFVDLIRVELHSEKATTRVSRGAYDEQTLGLTQNLNYYKQLSGVLNHGGNFNINPGFGYNTSAGGWQSVTNMAMNLSSGGRYLVTCTTYYSIGPITAPDIRPGPTVQFKLVPGSNTTFPLADTELGTNGPTAFAFAIPGGAPLQYYMVYIKGFVQAGVGGGSVSVQMLASQTGAYPITDYAISCGSPLAPSRIDFIQLDNVIVTSAQQTGTLFDGITPISSGTPVGFVLNNNGFMNVDSPSAADSILGTAVGGLTGTFP